MKKAASLIFILALTLTAQQQLRPSGDSATVQIGTPDNPMPLHRRADMVEGPTGTPVHPVYFEVRAPKVGCADTAKCGEIKRRHISRQCWTAAYLDRQPVSLE